MSKRYATVNNLGAETPMPLLDWLIHELNMDQNEMRNVSVCNSLSNCMAPIPSVCGVDTEFVSPQRKE